MTCIYAIVACTLHGQLNANQNKTFAASSVPYIMAGTLKPDPALQRFNVLKERYGTYFRFTPRSVAFVALTMGVIPAGLTYFAYATDGQINYVRKFRQQKVLSGEEYTPRTKDL